MRFAAALASLVLAALPVIADDKPTPKLPLGKDTTVVDGPLDKEGYIDYEAALNERLGKGITPEKNACAGLWPAIGPRPDGGTRGMPPAYFQVLGIAEPAADGKYFVDAHQFLRTLKLSEEERMALDEQFFTLATDRPWVSTDFPHVSSWLTANNQPLAVVYNAAKRAAYFQPTCSHRDKDSASHLSGKVNQPSVTVRAIAHALLCRAMVRTGEKRYEDAWQDLMTCHRLARHVMRASTLTETLIGIAVDVMTCRATLVWLDRADPSIEQLNGYLAEWQKLPPPISLADTLDLAERFEMLDRVQMIRRGKGLPLFGDAKPADPMELERLEAIDWAPVLREVNTWFDPVVTATRESSRAKREKFFDQLDERQKRIQGDKTPEQKLTELFGDGFQKRLEAARKLPADRAGKAIAEIVLDLMGSAVRKVHDSFDRAEQTRQNFRLAFALHAFQKDTGKYPPKLADLAPKYLPSIPSDLFSGKPLVYKPTDNGYLLYSIGANGKDDGGRTYGEYLPDDIRTGDDIVVRMPVPKR